MAEETKTQDTEKTKTFTQEEVNEIVNKRIAREKKNNAEAVANAKEEATKLAKMNRDQKKEYEVSQLTNRAKEAESKLAKYEMRDTARGMLNEEGINLNDDELSLVVTDNADTTQANAKLIVGLVKRIKNSVLEDFRKGKTPVVKNDNLTKADIMKIKDPEKRIRAIGEHRDLFS